MVELTQNFVIEQGTTFDEIIQIVDENDSPVDLTGYSALLQARRNANRQTPLLSITTDDHIIQTDNELRLFLPADMTADLPAGEHLYDMLLGQADWSIRLMEGKLVVIRGIARAT